MTKTDVNKESNVSRNLIVIYGDHKVRLSDSLVTGPGSWICYENIYLKKKNFNSAGTQCDNC